MLFFSACNTAKNPAENNAVQVTAKNETSKKAGVSAKNKLQKKVVNTASNNVSKKVTNKKEVIGSGKINWVDIEEVQKLAKQQPKKILIDAYTDWCGWCKRMDKNTFENPVIAKYINDNFYAVKLNAETKETLSFKGKNYDFVKGGRRGHNTLAKELLKGRMSYPTISFLDENLNLINAFPGYKSPQNFDALMNYINKNEFDKMGFTQYKASFSSNIPEAPKKLTNSTRKANQQIQKKVTVKPGVKTNTKFKNVITNPGKVNITTKKDQQNTNNKNKGN